MTSSIHRQNHSDWLWKHVAWACFKLNRFSKKTPKNATLRQIYQQGLLLDLRFAPHRAALRQSAFGICVRPTKPLKNSASQYVRHGPAYGDRKTKVKNRWPQAARQILPAERWKLVQPPYVITFDGFCRARWRYCYCWRFSRRVVRFCLMSRPTWHRPKKHPCLLCMHASPSALAAVAIKRWNAKPGLDRYLIVAEKMANQSWRNLGKIIKNRRCFYQWAKIPRKNRPSRCCQYQGQSLLIADKNRTLYRLPARLLERVANDRNRIPPIGRVFTKPTDLWLIWTTF